MRELLLVLVSVLFLTFPSQIFAHPGNTSYDGCHFCRTRCTYWGKTYGTRHGHYGQACDPALGPIDPLYIGGYSEPEPTPLVLGEEDKEEPTDLDGTILLALLGGFAFFGYKTLERIRARRN